MISKFSPKNLVLAVSLLVCSSIGLMAQEQMEKPTTNAKIVTLKGTILTLDVFRGRGPGRFNMRTVEGREVTVLLGSVRYLIQKGFNLSSGDTVEVKLLVPNEKDDPKRFVAVEVRNLTRGTIIRLRDERMRPLWCCRNF